MKKPAPNATPPKRTAVNLNQLKSFEVQASDGTPGGSVYDVVFDDADFAVEYVVADTGSWLSNSKVCIPPSCVGAPDPEEQQLPIDLSLDELEGATPVDRNPPVSREVELERYRESGWRSYWQGSFSPYAGPMGLFLGPSCAPAQDRDQGEGPGTTLRSMREVIGYKVQAVDGLVGQVRDFVVDDSLSRILYFVVAVESWPLTRTVLLLPTWVREIDHEERAVHVPLTRDKVETSSTEFDSSQPLDPEHAVRLNDLYAPIAEFMDQRSDHESLPRKA